MDHAVVQRWLRQVLGPYAEAERVYSDVDRTLLNISSLSPKTEVYTYDDGRTQLLLVLTGTVPMQYRTATYNIPVSVWVPRNYPREPPIVYVTPTSEMLVRKGRFVDPNGRVEGEYMQRWQRKWEACSLLELIHDCQAIFGQEPPVYAKPKAVGKAVSGGPSTATPSTFDRRTLANTVMQSPASPSTSVNGRDRGPAPLPNNRTSPAFLEDNTPLRPPKPGQIGDGVDRRSSNGLTFGADQRQAFERPHQRWSSHNPNTAQADMRRQQDAVQHRPAFDDRYTAEPMNTHGVGLGHPSHGMGQQTFIDPRSAGMHEQRHMSWNGAPPRSSHPLSPPITDMQAGPLRSTSLSSTTSHETATAAAPPLPPHMPSHHGLTAGREHANQPQTSPLSSVPAPPRPPNPELLHVHALLHAKLQQRLHYIRTTTEESNSQLQLLSEDLDRGDLAIKDEMARLEAVRDVCKTTGDELQRSVDLASQRLDELRAKEEPDVDGLLSATSLVGNQLLDLVAEDNAIEDTLYHLGRALNAETLDLDRFLKQTRFLAREQFMRRALAMKICRGMGWET